MSPTCRMDYPDMHKARRGGFTLIELLVVITIISILSAVVALNLFGESGKAKVTGTKANLKRMQQAVELYSTDNGMIPSQSQGLRALVEKAASEPVPQNFRKGGYLNVMTLPRDAWNRDFIYLAPGRRGEPFEILSYGRDGEPGGKDDAADLSSSEP